MLPGIDTYSRSNRPAFEHWTREYYRQGHSKIDPMALRLAGDRSPFAWSDVSDETLTRRQREFMEDAAAIGLKDGITVVTNNRNRPAYCTFTVHNGVKTTELVYVLDMIFNRFFQAIDRSRVKTDLVWPMKVLSRQELNCFSLYLQGFRGRDIAESMGIAEGTVRAMFAKIAVKLELPDMHRVALRYAGWAPT